MKKLILILALFVGNSFAEEEFPIQLTCEVGQDILYFNISDVREKTWMKAHPSSKDKTELNGNVLFYGKKWQREVAPRKIEFRVTSDHVRLSYSVLTLPVQILINRITGRINLGITRLIQVEGNCFKGFKEYKQKKF